MPRTVSLAVALLGAAAATQAPEFAQQYRQRLGGAIDELRAVVTQFDAEAAAQGLDRAAGIRRLQDNGEILARQRDLAIKATSERLEHLESQREAMQKAGAIGRIASLASNPDGQIARNALDAFEPAIPATGEGLAVGLAGFLASFGLLRLLALPFRGLSRTLSPRPR